MTVRFTVLSLSDPSKKNLIARRIARNPSVTLTRILVLLDHLPAVIFSAVDYMEAKELSEALAKMGCLCRTETVLPSPDERIPSPLPKPPREEPLPESPPKKASLPSQPVHRPEPAAVPQAPIRKAFPVKIVLAFAVLLILFSIGTSIRFLLPRFSKQALAQKRIEQKLSGLEERFSQGLADSQDVAQAVDLCRQMAALSTGPSRRIEFLSMALRLRPGQSEIRMQLAGAYADSAQRLRDRSEKVRFLLIAISFNPYNERAWENLVSAYREMGDSRKADETQAKQRSLFAGRERRIAAATAGENGRLLKKPALQNDVLQIVIRTDRDSLDEALSDFHAMCRNWATLPGVRFAAVRFSFRDGRKFEMVSPLENIPETMEDWKRKITVEPSLEN